jgi:hypothetical protein
MILPMKTHIILPGHREGGATGTGIRALIIGVSLFALCPDDGSSWLLL